MAESLPVARKPHFETLLCEAISKGVAVKLRYQKPGEMPDAVSRSFGPLAVYYSEHMKVCVSGEQLGSGSRPHNFEVGRIVDMSITSDPFRPSGTIDYTQRKYRNGIICRR